MTVNSVTTSALVLCLMCLYSWKPPCAAQAQSYSQIGYSPNISSQFFGVDMRTVNVQSLGGFGQFEAGLIWGRGDDETYEDLSNITAREVFGDEKVGEDVESYSLNGGVTYGLTDHVHVWGGVGVVVRTTYEEYRDPTHILAEDGTYWVTPEEKESDLGANVLGGIGVRLQNNVSFLLGGNANPSGVLFSIGYSFLRNKGR